MPRLKVRKDPHPEFIKGIEDLRIRALFLYYLKFAHYYGYFNHSKSDGTYNSTEARDYVNLRFGDFIFKDEEPIELIISPNSDLHLDTTVVRSVLRSANYEKIVDGELIMSNSYLDILDETIAIHFKSIEQYFDSVVSEGWSSVSMSKDYVIWINNESIR